MRNPVDLLFTWFRSGRGDRLGKDLDIQSCIY